jgi:hypothetical protein
MPHRFHWRPFVPEFGEDDVFVLIFLSLLIVMLAAGQLTPRLTPGERLKCP